MTNKEAMDASFYPSEILAVRNLFSNKKCERGERTLKGKKALRVLMLSTLLIILVCGLCACSGNACKTAMSKGEEYLDDKDYPSAIKQYKEAVKLDKDGKYEAQEALIDAYVKYAKALVKDEEYDDAIEQYENALEIEKNKKITGKLVDLCLKLARENAENGDKDQASYYVNKALEHDKKNEEALALQNVIELGELAKTPPESNEGGAASGNGGGETTSGNGGSENASGNGGGETASGNGGGENQPEVREGKVLNVCVWNDEFIFRLSDHYPGYEKIDYRTGKIGDVTVKFTVIPSDDNAYQDYLVSTLRNQQYAADDDKVDLFLLEPNYMLQYLDNDYAMKLSDVGIQESDLSDQFSYALDLGRDSRGDLKAVAWQACVGGMIYNRQIAREVLGTDDPSVVQQYVCDWDHFVETAKQVRAKGYVACSFEDTCRVYANNLSGNWIQDNRIVIDSNLTKWINDSWTLVSDGAEATYEVWSEEWAEGKYGNRFCYFGPAWFFNYCLDNNEYDSVGYNGEWGFCEGPQSYYWGGTYIAAAPGTDNEALVRDIMLNLTANPKVLKEIAVRDLDCVNSRTVLAELASDPSQNLSFLGGQNPYRQILNNAEKVNVAYRSSCDEICYNEFLRCMRGRLKNECTFDVALSNFQTAIQKYYPYVSY